MNPCISDPYKLFGDVNIPAPSILIIFGASGDLTSRKLMPALYNLYCAKLLRKGFRVIGFSRTPLNDEKFRELMKQGVKRSSEVEGFSEESWERFSQCINYFTGNGRNYEDLEKLADYLDNTCQCNKAPDNILFYLATPPTEYSYIVKSMEKAGYINKFRGQSRIVVEKPFGRDLESAEQLNKDLERVFTENQIFRIDHYLGKENVQNILVFRFANGIFEPIWNRRYIDHVQILIAESIGIENRGPYYEQAGALRDMVQNHMLQLLALTTMEPPVTFDSESVRDETVKAKRSIRPIKCPDVGNYVVRGQYSEGLINGKNVQGYRQEANVAPDSSTETYVALKVHIDNWRWAGVPFYLRTGKRLPSRVTEIAIFFKKAPLLLFRQTDCERLDSNILALRIQPDEGIFLRFGAKIPGPSFKIGDVDMDFSYKKSFGSTGLSAYERLLLDFMMGDSSNFARWDGVKAMWKFIDPIIEGWNTCDPPNFPNYAAGTWGPKAADEFIKRDGRTWRIP